MAIDPTTNRDPTGRTVPGAARGPMVANAPRLLDVGEAALVVEFGQAVDPAVHDRVLALDAALGAASVAGLSECVPTYRSLTIHYDPLVLDRAQLCRTVTDLLASAVPRPRAGRLWTVPCCYDPALAEDIEAVAAWAGLPAAQVAARHAAADYRVYMYGFAPGFAYLGGLTADLGIARRESPRPPHPRSRQHLSQHRVRQHPCARTPMCSPAACVCVKSVASRAMQAARPVLSFVRPWNLWSVVTLPIEPPAVDASAPY